LLPIEQTSKGEGCTNWRFAADRRGRRASDLLIFNLKGFPCSREGPQVQFDLTESTDSPCRPLFTLTNVDFDPARFVELTVVARAARRSEKKR